MNEQYLWDRAGVPDALEQRLESLLPALRMTPVAAPARAESAPSRSIVPWAAAAVVLLGVAGGAGLWGYRQGAKDVEATRVVAEPVRSGEAAPAVAPSVRPGSTAAPRAFTPAKPKPAPAPAPPSKALNPYRAPDPVVAPTPAPVPPAADDDQSSPTASRNRRLSTREMHAVIRRNKAAIAQNCWRPRAPKDPGKQATARLAVSIEIAPSGAVSSVRSTAAPAFPGLASCVTGHVRAWRFPSASATTTVNVPFVFSSK